MEHHNPAAVASYAGLRVACPLVNTFDEETGEGRGSHHRVFKAFLVREDISRNKRLIHGTPPANLKR